MTTRDELFVALARAERHAEHRVTKQQLRRARRLVGELPLRRLFECPVCGVLGIPERIHDHDCRPYATGRPAFE